MNLMPLPIYKNIGIGKVTDTRMNLKFADHSTKHPYGITEDVLVKIDKCIFLVDFMIVDMPEDEEIHTYHSWLTFPPYKLMQYRFRKSYTHFKGL